MVYVKWYLEKGMKCIALMEKGMKCIALIQWKGNVLMDALVSN